MRKRLETRMIRFCVAAAIWSSACSVTTVQAQAAFCNLPEAGGRGCGAIRALSEQVVTGEPYLAQAVTELQQTTADGTHITQSSTATIARDSQGRTVRSETLEGIHRWVSKSGSSGESGKTTLTTIFDPVASQHIDYTSDSGVAHVITMNSSGDAPSTSGQISGYRSAMDTGPALISGPPPPGAPAVAISMGFNPLHADSSGQSNANTVSLGTKTVDGLAAQGSRSTMTIPAGTMGNDKDIVVTQETWYSPELEMVLASIHSDPRFGVTTYSVTNLQREEPDASLFQVPAGYTVQRIDGQVIIGIDDAPAAK
jgi:hypothetical protein